MTLSVGNSFIIAIVAIICVAAFVGITLFASRRPYFKHPKPQDGATGVSGGRHIGDPRSVSPHGQVPIAEGEQAGPEEQEESAGRRSG